MPLTSHVVIPERVIRFRPDAYEKWKDAQKPWQQSIKDVRQKGHAAPNYSVWGEYAQLVEAGRFWIPSKDGHASYKFVEYHAALMLEKEGYECWGGVQLFDYSLLRKGKGPALVNTDAVRTHPARNWTWPSDVQDDLAFRPKNPDIVAYHRRRDAWRFVEVKSSTDRCHSDQIKALAVLHLLTGEAAEIMRVLPEGRSRKFFSYAALVEYKNGARLDWVAAENRRSRGSELIVA